MIGKTRSVIVEDFLKKSFNGLKKVDIDFFNEGLQTKNSWAYKFEILSPQKSIYVIEDITDGLGLEINNEELLLALTMDNKPLTFSKLSDTKSYCFVNNLEDGVHTITAYFDNNIIQKLSINSIKTKIVENTYMDIPRVDYHKSLDNVVKLWLLSRKFDRIRNPNWAGFFDNLLREYSMDKAGSDKIIVDLTNKVVDKIPGVIITEVKAEPNLSDKSWNISVKSVDTETNISTQFIDTDNVKVSQEDIKVLSK